MNTDIRERPARIIDMRPGVMEINGVTIGTIANEVLQSTSWLDVTRKLNLVHGEAVYGAWLAAKLQGTAGLQTWAKELDHLFNNPPMNFGRMLEIVRHPSTKSAPDTEQQELTLD